MLVNTLFSFTLGSLLFINPIVGLPRSDLLIRSESAANPAPATTPTINVTTTTETKEGTPIKTNQVELKPITLKSNGPSNDEASSTTPNPPKVDSESSSKIDLNQSKSKDNTPPEELPKVEEIAKQPKKNHAGRLSLCEASWMAGITLTLSVLSA